MVVVGDQSAGKSSVLESLTGFPFPRAVTLCTRHATEIVCRHEPVRNSTVSILPHNAHHDREQAPKESHRTFNDTNGGNTAKIFEEVGSPERLLA